MFKCNFATLFQTRHQNPYQTNYKPETLILYTYDQITIMIHWDTACTLHLPPPHPPTSPKTEKSTAICYKVIKNEVWLTFVTLFLAQWETFTKQIRGRSIPLNPEGAQNTGGIGNCKGAAGSLASTCPFSNSCTGGVVAAFNFVFSWWNS